MKILVICFFSILGAQMSYSQTHTPSLSEREMRERFAVIEGELLDLKLSQKTLADQVSHALVNTKPSWHCIAYCGHFRGKEFESIGFRIGHGSNMADAFVALTKQCSEWIYQDSEGSHAIPNNVCSRD